VSVRTGRGDAPRTNPTPQLPSPLLWDREPWPDEEDESFERW